ncbi:hypothetical protein [Enterococcus gilvus]|uniref:hypothetical protein n=1 Tax=Enterococcus gilvus TaxID=160453 RepID=UPI001C8B66F8|nr:hypothetical protein [Enterococcus gilvus]MBX8939228.1 hypothetical protein [Enterococcus gilvus]
MTEFSKTELEALLKDTDEHLAETKRLGPGYYGIRERYDYAVEADERYIEKLEKQIADYDLNTLNENQQIVLEWLEAYADKDSGDCPMQTIFYMWDCIRSNMLGVEELTALRILTRVEQFEVLAAFAEWGMKEVAE